MSYTSKYKFFNKLCQNSNFKTKILNIYNPFLHNIKIMNQIMIK